MLADPNKLYYFVVEKDMSYMELKGQLCAWVSKEDKGVDEIKKNNSWHTFSFLQFYGDYYSWGRFLCLVRFLKIFYEQIFDI